MVYILLTIRVDLGKVGLVFFLVRISSEICWFFPRFSGVVYVEGGWDLAVVSVHVVYEDGIICGRFVAGDFFLGVFFYVGVRIFYEFLRAVGTHDVNGNADLEAHDMTAGIWRRLGGSAGDDKFAAFCPSKEALSEASL